MGHRLWLLVLVGLLVQTASPGTNYRLTDLGVNKAESSFSVAINNRQTVVGYSNYPGSSLHPWVWSLRDGHQSLGFVGEVIAVNQRGWIAGTRGLLPNSEPFVIDNHGLHVLSLPNQSAGYATAMNDQGSIVGVMLEGFTGVGGFLWRNGKSVSINGSGMFFPYAVANNQTIVGSVVMSGRFRAAAWVDGNVTIIDPSGPGPSSGYSVNSDGMVVGSMAVGTGQTISAFVWTAKGGLINITPTSNFALCTGVNQRGQVVGSMDGRAFLWQEGNLHMLDDLVKGAKGWRFDWSAGINDRGQIVGTATYNELLRGFLLTPEN